MESALLMFAQLAVYVMGVLAQYLGTIHGLLQVRPTHAPKRQQQLCQGVRPGSQL